ncbi:MAG: hypothetical protein QOI29_2213 [Mycobacterium sp.]|nr:hypothetical protein [Mycobacterium sp.]
MGKSCLFNGSSHRTQQCKFGAQAPLCALLGSQQTKGDNVGMNPFDILSGLSTIQNVIDHVRMPPTVICGVLRGLARTAWVSLRV